MIPCHFINLDGEKDRCDFMQGQFARFNRHEQLARFAAKDFRLGIPDGAAEKYSPHQGGPYWQLSKGEVGCFESHMALWRKCAQGDTPALVILEDDVLLSLQMPDILDKLSDAADGFDVLHMDGAVANFRLGPQFELAGLAVRDVRATCPSAACYAVSKIGAQKLVARAEAGYCDHADDFVNSPGPNFRVLQLEPAVAIQTMWATRPDLGVVTSALQPTTATKSKRNKGPWAYRTRKKLRQSGQRLVRLLGGDARLLKSGGIIGKPVLADDLPQYRD